MDDADVDTVAGVLMSRTGKLPAVGDRVEFASAVAEILEVERDHAARIRFTIGDDGGKVDEGAADKTVPPPHG